MATNLRRGISQISATTSNKTLNKQLLEALMEQELQSQERIMERNRAWELEEQNRKERADAAKASGIAQLGGTAMTAAMLNPGLVKDAFGAVKRGGTAVMDAITPAPAVAAEATPAGVIPPGGVTPTMATQTNAMSTQGGFMGVGESTGIGMTSAEGAIAGAAVGGGIGATAGYGMALPQPAATAVVGQAGANIGTSTSAAAAGGLGSQIGATAFPALAGAGIGMLGANLLFPGNEVAESVSSTAGGALAGYMMAGTGAGPVGALIGGVIGLGVSLIDNVSVICTELNRQGHLPEVILILDTIHGRGNLDEYTYIGYRAWGDIVVKWMQKSKIVTHIVKPFAKAWAYEMASRVTPTIKGNLLGKALLKFGVPICRYIGKRKMEGAVWAS